MTENLLDLLGVRWTRDYAGGGTSDKADPSASKITAWPDRGSCCFACARIIVVKILVKSLIVWCLLLAVPFQGFASATMLFCAPLTSRDLPATAATAPSPHHDHAAMLAAQHAGHADHLSAAHGATPPGVDHPSAASHHDGSKCNSCAACCIGASMPPSASVPVAVDAQHVAAVPADTGAVPAVALPLPERPPQASLT